MNKLLRPLIRLSIIALMLSVGTLFLAMHFTEWLVMTVVKIHGQITDAVFSEGIATIEEIYKC